MDEKTMTDYPYVVMCGSMECIRARKEKLAMECLDTFLKNNPDADAKYSLLKYNPQTKENEVLVTKTK